MTDTTFWKGLAVVLSTFAILALVVGGVIAFGFLDLGHAPPAMDDLSIHNQDDVDRVIRVEVVPENGSDAVFSERVELRPDERVSFDDTTEHGESYRLVISVDDREPKSFHVTGPDSLCTTNVWVENATVDTGTSCA